MKFLSVDQPWADISEVLDKTRAKVFCAIGYIGKDAPSILRLGEGDVLVCDASDATVKSGSTYPEALLTYAKSGVRIYSVSGLHAKVIVTSGTAWIGSMNASESSRNLIEAAIRLENSQMVRQAREFILAQKSLSTPLTQSDIRRLINLPRRQHPRKTGVSNLISLDFPKIESSLRILRTEPDKLVPSKLQRGRVRETRREVKERSDDAIRSDSTLFNMRDSQKILTRRRDWILTIDGRSVKCPAIIADFTGTGRYRYVWYFRPNSSIQSISLKKFESALTKPLPEGDDVRVSAAQAKEIWDMFR